MPTLRKHTGAAFIWLIICTTSCLAERFYVDASASGVGDGSSWATAFNYLQDALGQTVASREDEVWIASGTYYPDDGSSVSEGSRNESFTLKDGVSIYGGFTGTERYLAERNPGSNRTSLSGKIWEDQAFWSLHVVKSESNSVVTIDGLTISHSNPNGANLDAYGGGILVEGSVCSVNECNFSSHNGGDGRSGSIYLASPKNTINLKSCEFTDNTSVLYSGYRSGEYTVMVDGCIFKSNISGINMGADRTGRAEIIVKNSVFSSNKGTCLSVDIIKAYNCAFFENAEGSINGKSVEVFNCGFVWNTSTGKAAGIEAGVATIANSTFYNNFAGVFGESVRAGTLYLYNNIFWHDDDANVRPIIYVTESVANENLTFPTPPDFAKNIIKDGLNSIEDDGRVDYSIGISSTYILSNNPLFVDTDNLAGADSLTGTFDDGLRLQAASPAIGQGNNAYIPVDQYDVDNDNNSTERISIDAASFARVQSGTIDLGAYEYGDQINTYYYIAIQANVKGEMTQAGSGKYSPGAVVSVTATPNNGYVFLNWVSGASGENQTSEVTVNSNLLLDARFGEYSDFNYEYIGNVIRITGGGPIGISEISVPPTIDGSPVTIIGSFAFKGRNDIAKVHIPSSVKEIEQYAFSQTTLQSVTLENGLETIGGFAFAFNNDLLSFDFPDSVSSIGHYTFMHSGNLSSVTIPEGIDHIGPQVFERTALTSITIPASVKLIWGWAFKNCFSMKEMTFLGNAPTMKTDAFQSMNATCIIKYYEGASGFTSPTWQGFATEVIERINVAVIRNPVVSVDEDAGFIEVVVEVSNPSVLSASVDYSFANLTATSGEDYRGTAGVG